MDHLGADGRDLESLEYIPRGFSSWRKGWTAQTGRSRLSDRAIGYLEFKIREHWVGLFRDLLKKANPLSDIPYNQDLSAAFEVLKVVVDGLSREGVALNADLVDTLDNEKLLKYTNDERTHAKQLVFVVFGWITTLYPTGFDPKANTLRIINS
ncbi:uncharacterized protein RSE6_01796 [Rhynchosporium secalis]|uniref:Uncharacterized protein n=1 Tax=Rhynchosporium secalis TaxID=38038 RepID=A0A1E1LYQ3_RHYSE|nr:uncharacterized protein RSE6_01796 [Rhynchosporium secalis]